MRRVLALSLAGLASACATTAPEPATGDLVEAECLALLGPEERAKAELERGGLTIERFCGCYGAEIAALSEPEAATHLEILTAARTYRDTEQVDGQDAIRAVRNAARDGEMPFTAEEARTWDDTWDETFDVARDNPACGAN